MGLLDPNLLRQATLPTYDPVGSFHKGLTQGLDHQYRSDVLASNDAYRQDSLELRREEALMQRMKDWNALVQQRKASSQAEEVQQLLLDGDIEKAAAIDPKAAKDFVDATTQGKPKKIGEGFEGDIKHAFFDDGTKMPIGGERDKKKESGEAFFYNEETGEAIPALTDSQGNYYKPNNVTGAGFELRFGQITGTADEVLGSSLESSSKRDDAWANVLGSVDTIKSTVELEQDLTNNPNNYGTPGFVKRKVIEPIVAIGSAVLGTGSDSAANAFRNFAQKSFNLDGAKGVETAGVFLQSHILPAITQETNRYTDSERQMARQAIAVLDVGITPESIAKSLGVVRSILTQSVMRDFKKSGRSMDELVSVLGFDPSGTVPPSNTLGPSTEAGEIITPKSKAERDALPSGTIYIDPTGTRRTRP